jgi:prepilin-type N-terminal cleavage/methylation domain-containing protein
VAGPCRERGFSLIEVLVATVIAVVAVLGLAHSFGAGRALVDRYSTARAALAHAQGRLDSLAILAAPTHNPGSADLTIGTHTVVTPLAVGRTLGSQWWSVAWVDDPVDGVAGGGDPNPQDYKRVTYYVAWNQGGIRDTVILTRTLYAP